MKCWYPDEVCPSREEQDGTCLLRNPYDCGFLKKTKVFKARSLETREPVDDSKRTSDFSVEMLKRWEKGREHYGTEVKIDPLEEAMEECVDIANYAMEQYFRIKKLKEELVGWQERK